MFVLRASGGRFSSGAEQAATIARGGHTPTAHTVVLEEYHKYLDGFSKDASDTLSPHSKYDHRI